MLSLQARTQVLKDEWVQIINKILVDSVADTVDMDIPNKVLLFHVCIAIWQISECGILAVTQALVHCLICTHCVTTSSLDACCIKVVCVSHVLIITSWSPRGSNNF